MGRIIRSIAEVLFKKMDAAYTQRSRTNNKLDKIIEQLNGLDYKHGGVTVEDSTPVVQPKVIGGYKCNADIDTTHAQKSLQLLEKAIDKLQQDAHIPHIRIEFDDINEVPKVYIDGKDITDWNNNGSALQELHLDWKTNDINEQPKSYWIQAVNKNGQQYGYASAKKNVVGKHHEIGDVVNIQYPDVDQWLHWMKVKLTEDGWHDVFNGKWVSADEVAKREV